MTLKIKNFQGHVDSELDIIQPGINSIIGPSDSGKSSIIRAIGALVNNGKMDRRHKSKETSVEWRGCKRTRSSSKNEYEVDGEVYKAMRTSVPKALTDTLRLGPVNFRGQHQPYFLLAESSGAVAREMNKLADLGMIDFVSTNLKAELRIHTEKLKGVEGDIEEKRKKIKALEWSIDADRDLREIESIRRRVSDYDRDVAELGHLLDGVEEVAAELAGFPSTDTAPYRSLQRQIVERDTSGLKKILDDIDEYSQVLSVCPPIEEDLKTFKEMKMLEPDGLGPILEELEGLKDYSTLDDWRDDPVFEIAKQFVSINQEFCALSSLLSRIEEADSERIDVTKQCVIWESEIQKLQTEAKLCPTCRRPYAEA